MRKHLSQLAGVERVMGMTAAVMIMVVVAIAVTGQLGLEDKTLFAGTIVVMVWHHRMQQDDCTRQRNHYFGRQMLHNMTFAAAEGVPWRRLVTLQRYTN